MPQDIIVAKYFRFIFFFPHLKRNQRFCCCVTFIVNVNCSDIFKQTVYIEIIDTAIIWEEWWSNRSGRDTSISILVQIVEL